MPIIHAWSNLSHDPAVQEALKRGAKDFLVKTDYALDQLVEIVKKHLNGSVVEQIPSPTAQPSPQAPPVTPPVVTPNTQTPPSVDQPGQ